ncbi:hypothetical protein [Sporichthya sp.]|uniref:hypothetical protein n=1 Tax=Sporichthya sp. TaxID=65475 RepID=UPI0017B99F0F|nr:hypothetical protein [Sporichthya sp.]MBA3743597.1 hypothetical protein [Sporichthya sp.]
MGTRARLSPRPEGRVASRLLAQFRPAVLAAGLTLLAAPYVGIVWERISPAPTYVNLAGEVYLDNQDSSEFIAADGWFLIIGLLLGIASAAVAYWRWRGDLGVIAAMSGASVLASLIAREVGEAFGPAPIQQTALTLADGETIPGSVTLASDGILFAWAVGILLTYLSLIGGLERSRAAEEDDHGQPNWSEAGWDPSRENPNGTHPDVGDVASVGAAGLAGDVGAGQRRQVGEHDPLATEKGELGP